VGEGLADEFHAAAGGNPVGCRWVARHFPADHGGDPVAQIVSHRLNHHANAMV